MSDVVPMRFCRRYDLLVHIGHEGRVETLGRELFPPAGHPFAVQIHDAENGLGPGIARGGQRQESLVGADVPGRPLLTEEAVVINGKTIHVG